MKRDYINLRHQQYTEVTQSGSLIPLRSTILIQIPLPAISLMLNYLRLHEISQLYNSLVSSHKHQQVKTWVFNYLILSPRCFSKEEQKQFLNSLTLSYPLKNLSLQKDSNFSHSLNDKSNSSINWRSSEASKVGDRNQRSRLLRFKESILNDVDRTFIKLSWENNSNKTLRDRQETRQKNLQNCGKSKTQSSKEVYVHTTLATDFSKSIFAFESQKSTFGNVIQSGQLNIKMLQKNGLDQRMQQMQQQKMQSFLKSVLLTTCQKYKKLGYIQGFNYIVRNMYLTGLNEKEACRYLSYFLEQKRLGSIILNNMAGIKKLSYSLKVYIFNYLPKIYHHFNSSEVEPEVFCLSWFVTLFSEDLSVEIVNKLWHLFVLQGWKIFIKFAISFLCAYQNQILTKEPDEIFTFMRRIMENFNQECKARNGIGHFIWDKNPRRQDIVWKLMTSVEVDGITLNKLCREMTNLQSDSEIELWRIEQNSRNLKNASNIEMVKKKSMSSKNYFQRHEKSAVSLPASAHTRVASQLCCDRVYQQTNQNSYSHCRPNNIFSLCHNIDANVD